MSPNSDPDLSGLRRCENEISRRFVVPLHRFLLVQALPICAHLCHRRFSLSGETAENKELEVRIQFGFAVLWRGEIYRELEAPATFSQLRELRLAPSNS